MTVLTEMLGQSHLMRRPTRENRCGCDAYRVACNHPAMTRAGAAVAEVTLTGHATPKR